MKKLLIIFAASILGMVACNESSVSKPSFNNLKISAPMPPGWDNEPPNYCKGCGNSIIAADACHGDDCREDLVCEWLFARDLAEELNLDYNLSDAEAYEIRDSFLIKNSKGQQYISHYYELGGFLYDNNLINLSNIGGFISFANDIYAALNLFRFGNSNDIILDSQLKEKCITYVNIIRNENPPNYIANRLNMIEDDLNLYENKTKSFILNNL
jgi:hypothetical protein